MAWAGPREIGYSHGLVNGLANVYQPPKKRPQLSRNGADGSSHLFRRAFGHRGSTVSQPSVNRQSTASQPPVNRQNPYFEPFHSAVQRFFGKGVFVNRSQHDETLVLSHSTFQERLTTS